MIAQTEGLLMLNGAGYRCTQPGLPRVRKRHIHRARIRKVILLPWMRKDHIFTVPITIGSMTDKTDCAMNVGANIEANNTLNAYGWLLN